jgi:hypothetical protein
MNVTIDLSDREINSQSFDERDIPYINHYTSQMTDPTRISLWEAIELVQSISRRGACTMVQAYLTAACDQERLQAAVGTLRAK